MSAYMIALICQHTLDLPEEEFCGFYAFYKEVPIEGCCKWWVVVITVVCIRNLYSALSQTRQLKSTSGCRQPALLERRTRSCA